MKSKILFLLVVALCCIYNAMSCPTWRIGKMYIVDENNKPIQNARVWVYSSLTDSFKFGKSKYFDTNAYYFWTGGLRFYRSEEERKPANKCLLIQAEGYAEVAIKELKFTGKVDYSNEEETLPVLLIKVYTKRYVKKGDLFTLMNNYICEKRLEVKDSLIVGIDDYTESIREANTVVNAQRVSAYIVKTYPNPVKDKLNIEINATVTKPYKAILLDVQGKLINESQLTVQQSTVDMEWQSAGIYFIQVFDPEGVLLYAFKFIKT